jgi:hypothetical protein
MLADVRQRTIRPVIEATVAKGALVHTDEYDVHARLDDWGYGHETVCHARGEYARDEDGDGFRKVHVNTAEGTVKLSAKGTGKRRSSLELRTYAAALASVISAQIANACARTAR